MEYLAEIRFCATGTIQDGRTKKCQSQTKILLQNYQEVNMTSGIQIKVYL